MQHFRNILVGVDLSHADRLAASELNPPTLEAIKRATGLAAQTSAAVTFFSALDITARAQALLSDEFEPATHHLQADAERVLAELVSRAKQEGVEAAFKLSFGQPWVEIIRQVLTNRHDLVVIGTRDLSAPGRLLLGSTAMKLLRNCPGTVWVTKPDPDGETTDILIASDLDETSHLALDLAVNTARQFGSKLHLLHALELSVDRHIAHTGLPEQKIKQLRQQEHTEAEKSLHDQLSQSDYRTLPYGVQTHVIGGPADVVILEAIEQHEIDLLVIGTIGRSGLPGMFIGNTAERLLPQVDCSLLVVKPPEFATSVTLE